MNRNGTVVNSDWRTIPCEITCTSREMLRQLEEMTVGETNLNHTITRTLEYLPGEIEKRTYRLGDYFERIELLHDERSSKLRLTFYVRPDVDSHWKDLLMAVLRSIGSRFGKISVEFPRPSP